MTDKFILFIFSTLGGGVAAFLLFLLTIPIFNNIIVANEALLVFFTIVGGILFFMDKKYKVIALGLLTGSIGTLLYLFALMSA